MYNCTLAHTQKKNRIKQNKMRKSIGHANMSERLMDYLKCLIVAPVATSSVFIFSSS